MDFIAAVEAALGREAKKVFLPMQPGDVPKTFANIDDLVREVGFRPSTPLRDGVGRFVAWYRSTTGKLARDSKCRAAWPEPSVPHWPDRPARVVRILAAQSDFVPPPTTGPEAGRSR